MVTNHEYIYITLEQGGYVQVKLCDEGVIVDIFENDKDVIESIATTYASYRELSGK